jgi:hypothetical protein
MTRCSIGLISAVALAALFTAPMPAAAEKTVKVFILAGQSNMVGHGKVEMGRNPDYVKGQEGSKREIKGGMACLRTLATDPKTAAKYKPWLGADGKWVEREDVLIYSTAPGKKTGKLSVGFGKGGWFGPELGFGHVVGEAIDEPVLIIKTAWGGHDLGVKFRPPSAGQPAYAKMKFKPEDVGSSYREMMKIVKEVTGNLATHFPALAGHKVEFAGFGWHQGWNDGGSDEMVNEYASNMSHLIRDIRKELGAAKLPVVIANTGMVGWEATGRRKTLCEVQMSMGDPKQHPEFAGTVASVETRGFDRPETQSPSDFGYHWKHNAESHYLVGEAMGEAMVKLLKRAK